MNLLEAIKREWPTAQCSCSDDAIMQWDGPMPQPSDADIQRAVDRYAAFEPWDRLRRHRNVRLVQSDWTQLLDAPFDAAARVQWQTYRQALRDLPQTQDDPANIVWPVAP